jgi:ornithine decarboxylase
MDRLPAPLMLPAGIAEDDFIEFGAMGAYGAATATRFNGYEIKDTVPVRHTFAA